MNVEDEQWVEHTLIDYERKRSISKVLSIDCKDAIPKGNNYASDMLRLNMNVVLHSGDVVNKSVIYKALPRTEVRMKFIKDAKLHTREAKMLTEIWPEMERIRQEKECGIERISPLCYGIKRGFEGCLLEDLTTLGYKMADRMELLDLKHAKLVMCAYAQLHALSLVLIERGDLVPNDFNENYFYQHPKQFEPLIVPTLLKLATDIEENWDAEWHCYAEKLRDLSKIIMERFVEDLKFKESNVNALLHGDCWLTNMMFKYNIEGSPQNVRLLDFQICNFNNVGLDLQYFFNSSLNADARMKKKELVRLYYEHFKSSLLLYEYSGEIPTFEHVLESYNRCSYYGLAIGLTFVVFVVQPTESIPDDLEQWAKDLVEEKGLKTPSLESESLRELLKVGLKQGRSNGIL